MWVKIKGGVVQTRHISYVTFEERSGGLRRITIHIVGVGARYFAVPEYTIQELDKIHAFFFESNFIDTSNDNDSLQQLI